jgi:hypothetical protein
MHIDARSLDVQEVLSKLKELLSSACGREVDIEITINSLSEAAKVKAFATMSGCRTEVAKKGECYIIYIKGIPCCT